MIHYHRQNLFSNLPEDAALAHCVSADLVMGKGIAVEFKRRFGRVDDLKNQNKVVGEVASLQVEGRSIYYLVTKEKYWNKPTPESMQSVLKNLREQMEKDGVSKLYLPKIGCGLDRMNWETQVEGMLQTTFHGWDGELHVCFL